MFTRLQKAGHDQVTFSSQTHIRERNLSIPLKKVIKQQRKKKKKKKRGTTEMPDKYLTK